LQVEQDESQEEQDPPLVKYLPAIQEAQLFTPVPVQVAQEGSQQVEPTRANEDEQEAHVVRVPPVQVKQDESQEEQAPPIVKYFPFAQEVQLETPVPLQAAQEGSQQVEPMRANDDWQETHPVLPAALHVKQDESQVEQDPLLVKYFPAIQEEHVEEVVPLQVAQEGSQQVEPTRVKEDWQVTHPVLPAALQVKQDESQEKQAPPLVRYFPVTQEAQLFGPVPVQVAQEGSQQVVPTLTNGDRQERHPVLPAALQVKQDESQALQTPPLK